MNTEVSVIPSKKLQVPVDLDQTFPKNHEAVAALSRLGGIVVSGEEFRDLKSVGVYVHGLGAIRLAQGSVMVTQQLLNAAMKAICKELEKASEIKSPTTRCSVISKLTHSLGYLSYQKTASLNLMLNLEGGNIPQDPANIGLDMTHRVKSFAAGSEVKPNQTVIMASHVHMQGSEAPSTAK